MSVKQTFRILMLLLSFSWGITAQQGEMKSLLKKVADFYTNSGEYYIDINYKMYRGLTGNQVTESYNGVLIKKGAFYKMEVLGTEVLQFGDEKLILDHNNKLISYAKDKTQNPAELITNMNTFLQYYNEYQILDKGSNWVCEFVSSKKNIQQLPYGRVLLYVNKKTYALARQELYFSSVVPFKGKNGDTEYDYGRLIITLENSLKKNTEITSLEDYIKSNSEGKIELREAFSAYRVIDQTQ